MNSKKADMSISVIIAAAIGLIILVVLIIIFTNATGTTTSNIDKCSTKGGTCVQNDDGLCPAVYPVKILTPGDCSSNDLDKNGVCCIKAKN